MASVIEMSTLSTSTHVEEVPDGRSDLILKL
jgi:hypothetical protein